METIETGFRKGWRKTTDHEYVGKTIMSVSEDSYKIVSYLPQLDEFETEKNEGKMTSTRESIEEGIRRQQNFDRNGFIHPFEFI